MTDTAAPVLVCLRAPDEKPLYFFDDMHGNCSLCGHRIRFRPHVAEITTKIFCECVPAATAGAVVPPQAYVTPETVAELLEYRGRKRS